MTLLGCFTVLMMYLESYLETPEGIRTNLYPLRTSREVLSLQNITFLQSAIVQCLYILQNNILFFIMTLVIRGFLAVGDMAFSDPFTDGAGVPAKLKTLREIKFTFLHNLPLYHVLLENLCMFFSRMQLLPKGTSSPHVV